MTARAPSLHFAPVGEERQDELHAINRACPIQADFTFFFDRTPDFFAWSRCHFEEPRYAGIFEGDRLIGYGMTGLRRGRLGGHRLRYFYLGDWRLVAESRGNNLGRHAAEWLLARLPEDVTLGLGLVKRGNRPVEHIMSSNPSEVWRVKRLCGFNAVNIVPLWAPRRGINEVRRARAEDLDEVAEVIAAAARGRPFAPAREDVGLLLSSLPLPGLDLESFFVARCRGRITGVVAAWDRSSFHRSTVLDYTLRGAFLRGALSALGRSVLRRIPPLPAPGKSFRALTLCQVAIPDRDPRVLADLLRCVLHEEAFGRYHLVHLGLVCNDPLLAATRGLLTQSFLSDIHLMSREVEPPGNLEDPWIDLAMI